MYKKTLNSTGCSELVDLSLYRKLFNSAVFLCVFMLNLSPFKLDATTIITAPSLFNICAGSNTYIALGDIVIAEGVATDFGVGCDQSLILGAPALFEFKAGVGNVSSSGTDITGTPMIIVTASQITISYNVGTVSDLNSLTISGIQIKATTPSSNGNVLRTGGNAIQAGNSVGNMLVHATFNSSANTCPEINMYTPLISSIDVAIGDNLILDFNVNVKAGGAGDISITPINPAGASLMIPIGDPQVTIGGSSSMVIINPNSDLDPSTEYEIMIDAGAIESDPSSIPFAGLGPGDWTFTTAANIFNVSNEAELDNSLANVDDGDIIQFNADISITSTKSISKDITIKGNGHTLYTSHIDKLIIPTDRSVVISGLMFGTSVASIPAMGQWALIILALSICILGSLAVKEKRILVQAYRVPNY